MSVSMISVDLDGTLLLNDKTISERTILAARSAMARGALFVLNSGRMPDSMRQMAREVSINAPILCFNGALTYDLAKDAPLASLTMDHKTASALARSIESRGIYLQGFWGNEFCYDRRTKYTDFYEKKASVVGRALGGKISEAVPEETYKLLMIGEPGEARALIPALEEEFGDLVAFTASSDTFVECVSARANKGAALLALGEAYGLGPENIMAFGDEQNDLSMLEAVSHGYAMGNASDAVKARARYAAPSNTEDGVAQVIERYLRSGLIVPPGGKTK